MTRRFGGDSPWMILTDFGVVRVSAETQREILAEHGGPDKSIRQDRRTKAWRAMEAFERDVMTIAEAEWTAGGELREV